MDTTQRELILKNYNMETREQRREKMAAIGTMALIGGTILLAIISFFTSLIR
jgi:hypothetical protein